MIAIRKPPTNGFEIPSEARAAIASGVKRGDAVAQLEFLGFSPRYMNLLENSPLEIITLEQLVQRSRDELLEIPGFGNSALHELMDCLARYDELEDVLVEQDQIDQQRARVAREYN